MWSESVKTLNPYDAMMKGEKTMKTYTTKWLRAAAIRSVKTFAQTAVAMIPAAVTITAVDWATVLGTAALAAVGSLLTSLGGLPEVER